MSNETLDAVEGLPPKYKGLAIASGVALVLGGVLIGGGIGYKIAEKRLKTKFDQLLDEEITEAKKRYARLNKRDEFETPEKALNVLHETEAGKALQSYQGGSSEKIRTTKEVKVESVSVDAADEGKVEVAKNVFVEQDALTEWDSDDFIYTEEIKLRSPEKPYILTQDEYMNNESEYEQSALTYYVGDDVLVDERDEPINESDRIVGDDNLLRFGHGTKDNRIVYVRNDRMKMEWEIIQNMGKYTEQVLGFIEHSDRRPPIRRFRGDYE